MASDLQDRTAHPFWQGFYAHEAGKDEYDNPYPDDPARAAWEHGRETAERSVNSNSAQLR